MNFEIKPDSFLLSGDRVFFSLQGEGESIGKPAVFLRLHLCNLQCSFCDTPYTWDKKDKRFFSEPERWELNTTFSKVLEYPCRRLVITGGEPLLHSEAIDTFLEMFSNNYKFEIETNGTMAATAKMIMKKVRFNVSPKLQNSHNPKKLRYRPDVLKQLNTLRKTTFKFVVINNKDLDEIEQIVRECGLDKDKIILMPEGITQKDVSKHGRAVAELCKNKGWRLVPRLHIMLWGDERNK